jgi:hypothetical protein
MAARIFPVERSRSIEVWHDAAEYPNVPGEDRLIAISVVLPRPQRKAGRSDAAHTEWPAPVLGPMQPGA